MENCPPIRYYFASIPFWKCNGMYSVLIHYVVSLTQHTRKESGYYVWNIENTVSHALYALCKISQATMHRAA